MLRHDPKIEVGYALLAVAGSSVLAALVLHLWNASLGVPFFPSGDGNYVLMEIKGELDTGWVLNNSHLGAPFGQDLHDFAASRELIHVLVVKLLGLFTSNPGTIYNLYYLLSFPLVALAAYVVMRWLGLSPPAAVRHVRCSTPWRRTTSAIRRSCGRYYSVPLAAYLILADLLRGASVRNARRSGQLAVALRLAKIAAHPRRGRAGGPDELLLRRLHRDPGPAGGGDHIRSLAAQGDDRRGRRDRGGDSGGRCGGRSARPDLPRPARRQSRRGQAATPAKASSTARTSCSWWCRFPGTAWTG